MYEYSGEKILVNKLSIILEIYNKIRTLKIVLFLLIPIELVTIYFDQKIITLILICISILIILFLFILLNSLKEKYVKTIRGIINCEWSKIIGVSRHKKISKSEFISKLTKINNTHVFNKVVNSHKNIDDEFLLNVICEIYENNNISKNFDKEIRKNGNIEKYFENNKE